MITFSEISHYVSQVATASVILRSQGVVREVVICLSQTADGCSLRDCISNIMADPFGRAYNIALNCRLSPVMPIRKQLLTIERFVYIYQPFNETRSMFGEWSPGAIWRVRVSNIRWVI